MKTFRLIITFQFIFTLGIIFGPVPGESRNVADFVQEVIQRQAGMNMKMRKARLLSTITGANDTPFERAVKELMSEFIVEAEADLNIEKAKLRLRKKSLLNANDELSESEKVDNLEQAILEALAISSQEPAETTTVPNSKDSSVSNPSATTYRPIKPNGLLGSVENFISIIPHAPGAFVETGYNTGKLVVELLPLPNVTDVVQSTLTGVRKQPVQTFVTGLSNLVFCNPVLAGLNYGRCYAWFQTRENEEEIRINKINQELGKEPEQKPFFGIFGDDTNSLKI